MEKATNIHGLGTRCLIKIPVTHDGEMHVGMLVEKIEEALAEGKRPIWVGGTAGTTVRGAYDPIVKLLELRKRKVSGCISMALGKERANQFNLELRIKLHHDGISLVGYGMHEGKLFLRLLMANAEHTTEAIVRYFTDLIRTGKSLSQEADYDTYQPKTDNLSTASVPHRTAGSPAEVFS